MQKKLSLARVSALSVVRTDTSDGLDAFRNPQLAAMSGMEHHNPETLKDPGGESGPIADWDNSETFCPEKEQSRCCSCLVTEDLTASWSPRSISRSLQRAETLLRSTFNPSLKWLFHGHNQDEDLEEENFVVAPNLVSRSSARLQRLQQALLAVAPQWQQVGEAQVCAKGLPAEGSVLLLPCSSFLQGHYRTLRRLTQQRSLLLFVHEYLRRARLTAAFVSRVSHLLEEQLRRSHRNQNLSSWSSHWVGLGSLSHELRVHLNHWSCLVSKVQSDSYLQPALVPQPQLLVNLKKTLDSLGLQALVLMEHYVYVVLSAVAQTDLNSVPREVLEDIVAGTELYNQAVEEQRAQRRAAQLRTAVLQQAHYSTVGSRLPNCKGHHPAAFSVKELTVILAVHHAERAAQQLQRASEHSHQMCPLHDNLETNACSDDSIISHETSTPTSEWTWEQLQQTYRNSSPLFCIQDQPALHSSTQQTCSKTLCVPDLHVDSSIGENQHPVHARPASVLHGTGNSDKNQTSQCQMCISQPGLAQSSENTLDSLESNLQRHGTLDNRKLPQTILPPSTTSVLPLSEVCHQDHSSVQRLFQVLVSSRDFLAPLVSNTPTPQAPSEQLLPNTLTANSVQSNRLCAGLNKDQTPTGTQHECAEREITIGQEMSSSSGLQNRDLEREETVGTEGTTAEPDCVRCPHSVQWLDLGQSLVFDDLFGQYLTLLWTLCGKALWLQLHAPAAGDGANSINLQDNRRVFQILHQISQLSKADLAPKESRIMLEDLSLYLLVTTSHAQWDYDVCRSLGSALKDKCLTDANQASHTVMPSPKQYGSDAMSTTMEHFLRLFPPLLSSLCWHLSNTQRSSGSCSLFCSRRALQRQTLALALATVQLCTVWVMSKAYQFLSSWSLNRFLLVTQGDLKVLRESLEVMMNQTKSLMISADGDQHSTLHRHNQLQMRQQLGALDRAVCELQTFSSLVLKTFSSGCKRMSGEIFEETMPPAIHWRPRHRAGFPISPSEYASLAAQTVIGQVLEGVAPLSDDARVQALSVTMTAFMEAWMEHILKQRIKFSVQGALQLKQDFDSIREMIQADKYGLSAELHQRLLSLRVFQQVDSAVMCLLQQPQAKPYLQPRAWEPFTSCCPANSSRSSIDAAVGSSITNLRSVAGEDLTQEDPSLISTNGPSVDGEPYLAPSAALGAAQQEWLNLRIHSSSRRWRLPGLQCLSKSEP
ncbi:hypothetical protein Q5P01_009384 [Channa striata]|uniref:Coiled-coil protein 142 C-terminal domain-containing protein n=1 Tax=Channa striata TaxID=64152 RepID=A0AA88N2G1_CHASR|nr:hypothetical protein Q5P01_009384 [Channa striata]